jgi:Ran GTPase-activating protein (RanGAP) involved in mRNA processing and transport
MLSDYRNYDKDSINYNEIIIRIIKKQYQPEKIDLSSMELSDDFLIAMLYVVKKYGVKAKELLLSKNMILDRGATCLADYFSWNKNLNVVDISCDHLIDENFALICHGLEYNVLLKKLNISDNKISSDGIKALSAALSKNNNIISLDLSRNQLNAASSLFLSNFLHNNKSLQHLYLSRNPLGDEGIMHIVQGILDSNVSTLQFIKLKDTKITSKGCHILEKLISNCSSLNDLDISNNDIGSHESIQKLLGETNNFLHNLRGLNLSSCNITEESLKTFINKVSKHNKLHSLNISYNRFSENVFSLLIDLLRVCPNLQNLDIRGFKLDKDYLNENFLMALKNSKVINLDFSTPSENSSFCDAIKNILTSNKQKNTALSIFNTQNQTIIHQDIHMVNQASIATLQT